jgi:hypothetical protein
MRSSEVDRYINLVGFLELSASQISAVLSCANTSGLHCRNCVCPSIVVIDLREPSIHIRLSPGFSKKFSQSGSPQKRCPLAHELQHIRFAPTPSYPYHLPMSAGAVIGISGDGDGAPYLVSLLGA